MKKIIRMIIFSTIALYLTSLWNKGFLIKFDWLVYLKASLLLAAIYYLVLPLTKIVFLPLNIISFGLVSLVLYGVIFYFFINHTGLIEIKSWHFSGASFYGIIISPKEISYLANIFLSAFSLSTIINLLEKIL